MPMRRKKVPRQPRVKSTPQVSPTQRVNPLANQESLEGPLQPGDVRGQDCDGLFTINEALLDPVKCRSKCDAIFWEEKVMEPVVRAYYHRERKPTDPLFLQSCIDDSSLERIYYDGIQVARTHRGIAQAVMETSWKGGFPRVWQKLTKDQRIKLIAQAIDIGIEGWQLGGIRRICCPDISLKLAEGDEILEMLKHITYSGLKYPKSDNYLLLRCAVFEQSLRFVENSSDTELPPTRAIRALEASWHNVRNQAIADFMFCLVQTRTMLEDPSFTVGAVVRKPRKQTGNEGYRKNFARSEPVRKNAIFEELRIGPMIGFSFPTMDKKTIDAEKICGACRRYAIEIKEFDTHGDTDPFLYCSKCRRIDRLVTYCSQDCQTRDWNNHKTICGQRLSDLGLDFAGEHSEKVSNLRGPPPSFRLQNQLYLAPFLYNKEADIRGPFYTFLSSQPSGQCLQIPRHPFNNYLEILFERALGTMNEVDIGSFVTELAAYSGLIAEVKPVFVDQIAKDWEVDLEKVRKWAEEGWRILQGRKMRELCGYIVEKRREVN